jgi:hypothetical protein
MSKELDLILSSLKHKKTQPLFYQQRILLLRIFFVRTRIGYFIRQIRLACPMQENFFEQEAV